MNLSSISPLKIEMQQIISKDNVQTRAYVLGVRGGGPAWQCSEGEKCYYNIRSGNQHFLRANPNAGTVLGLGTYRHSGSSESSQSSRGDNYV